MTATKNNNFIKIGNKQLKIKWPFLMVVFFIVFFVEFNGFWLGILGVVISYTVIGFMVGRSFQFDSASKSIIEEKKNDDRSKKSSEEEKSDRTTMLLVKRDMELTKANRELDAKIKELEASKESLLKALEEVKMTSASLESEKEKTLAVVSNFTTPIVFLDKNNKLALFNPAATKYLGLRVLDYDKPIGSVNDYSLANFKNIFRYEFEFISVEDEDKNDDIVLEEEMIVKEGKHNTIFKVITANVSGKNGEYLGVIKIFYDLTREKALDKLKSEFISVAAHQLRTPLAAIKWIFEMVLSGDTGAVNEEQKKFLSKGHESNERIIGLVNDLLNVSRIEEGRFGYNFSECDFDAILDEAVGYFENLIVKHKIKLTVKKDDSKKNVKVDKERILMVLQNLIENAIKYTPEYGKVDIGCNQEEKFLRVIVSDNGVGIPESDQEKLFSKFFRAANVLRMQTEGSGLGLFIVKNIIEKHGGQIMVESREGNGTKISFTLPLSF